jgi:amino acid adenylation domain-containing protein
VAGALSLDEAVRVIALRSRLLRRLSGTGTMASVPLSVDETLRVIDPHRPSVAIASSNSPRSTVITGETAALTDVVEQLLRQGVSARFVNVDVAAHGPQTAPLGDELQRSLESLRPMPPVTPFFSTVAGWDPNRLLDAGYWALNLTEPVDFTSAMQRLIGAGCTTFLEISPHPILVQSAHQGLIHAGKQGTTLASIRRDAPARVELLHSLAQLYGSGRPVAWEGVYGRPHRPVRLPRYPWRRDRFWIDARPDPTAEAVEPLETVGDSTHPLLGRRVALAHDPRAHVWQLDWHLGMASFLQDHRVNGRALVPASAFIEMALAAAERAGLTGGREIVELDLSAPLVLLPGEHRTVQVALCSTERPERFTFAVHSNRAAAGSGESGEWTLHATAALIADPRGEAPPSVDLAAIRAAVGEEVTVDALYRALRARGLEYGSTMRGIERAWGGAGEAIGRIELPASLHPEEPRYQIHPTTLDAALQVLVAATLDASGSGTETFLPIGCDRVRLYRRPGTVVWSHVVLTVSSASEIEASVRLIDDDGRIVAELTGVRLVRQEIDRGGIAPSEQHTWFYRVEWQAIAPPNVATADVWGKPGPSRWLILADRNGIAEAVRLRLEERGQRCGVIRLDEVIGDPATGEPEAARQIAAMSDAIDAALRTEAAPLRGIIQLASATADGEPLGIASLLTAQVRGAHAVLRLVQGLVEHRRVLGTPRLWLVTRGTQPVLGDEPTAPAQAPVWGLGRTIGFELPELNCTLVDLDPADAVMTAADRLVEELAVSDEEDQIAIRHGRRWAARLVPRSLPIVSPPALRADGTYLITGGLGGLGLAVGGWMVERGARHLVLIGRTEPAAFATTVIERLRAIGADVMVMTADVGVPADLARVFHDIHDRLPPVRGVVHAAGVLDNGPIVDLDVARMTKVLAPKVAGAWNLHTATKLDPLDFFVLFSSAVSVLGSPGQGNYAAANTFLDALSYYRHRQGLPAVSINWGPWVDVGLVASGDFLPRSGRSSAEGVKGITPSRGLEALGRVLRDEGVQQTVLPFDIASLLELYPTAARMPFFSLVGGQASHVSRWYNRPSLRQEYVAPRNEVEQRLADLWRQTLRIDRVGVRDSFFELGGDSVLAAQLVTSIHQAFRVRIDVREAFRAFTIEHLAERIATSGHSPSIPARHRREGPVPLSFVQERQLFLELLEPLTAVNNLSLCLRIDGPLDVGRLERSANQLVARHDVLRTSFATSRGIPVATIAATVGIPLEVVDLEGAPPDPLAEALRLARVEAEHPFALDEVPLLRVRLYRLAAECHVFLVVIHHAIADGWSLGVFLREIFSGYQATESTAAQRPLPIQYADFAAWQRDAIAGPLYQQQLDYWRGRLGGELPILDLPTDHSRSPRQTFSGATHRFSLPLELARTLKELSRREDATPFMALVAGFAALLHRWCGQDDLVIGTPTAGRTHPETDSLIGPFINTLALRVDGSGDPSFTDLLRRVRAVALEAYQHQDLPFEKLVAELRPQRDLSRTPVFQALFVLQNSPLSPAEVPGLSFAHLPIDRGTAAFDLTLTATETAQGIDCAFEYNTDLFARPTIERLGGTYRRLLLNAAATPEERLSHLKILSEVERDRLIRELNETEAEYPRDAFVPELFEAQAVRTPDAAAVICGGHVTTYGGLQHRMDEIAGDLRRFGVGVQDRVAVLLERSSDLVATLLAVQKIGAVYLPIDPGTPPERIAFMLRDATVHTLVTDGSRSGLELDSVDVYRTDQERLAGWPRPASSAREIPSAQSLAYVIYTSGSTGHPKGVAIRHGALVNVLWSMRQRLDLQPSDRLLAITSISFDIAGLELYLPLLVGATVVVATQEMLASSTQLQAAIANHGVTVMQATPAGWRMLLQGGWRGAPSLVALCGGEPLGVELAAQLLARVGSLWNLYGPTETTIWSAGGKVSRGRRPITIGQPIANTELYVLGRNLEPVPLGAVGELYIGGEGVSPGYVNRPELTRERFVPDPFGRPGRSGGQLFRTGDRARRGADGSIEVIGRLDDQMKINGFRIEPAEIESALSRHASVHEAAVVAREASGSGRNLVAYIVASREPVPEKAELRGYLRAVLPAYMVPTTFVVLPSLPRTQAGKIDRRALMARPEPPSDPVQAAPNSPLERKLAATVGQVLGLPRVGIHENFFDLGGGSIQIMEIIAHGKADGLHLTPEVFFEHQTIAELAVALADAAQDA